MAEQYTTCDDLERKIVHYCAATLAGIKPANLFTYRSQETEGLLHEHKATQHHYPTHLIEDIRTCQKKLAPHGVRLAILAPRKRGALIYAYRPTLLKQNITQHAVSSFLTGEGYDVHSLSGCIKHLRERIRQTDHDALNEGCSFPHEIGLFLGYPFDDVMGFIENKGENFLCSGCWKVYSKQRDAQACFCSYKNCTNRFETLFENGVSLEELARTTHQEPLIEAYPCAG